MSKKMNKTRRQFSDEFKLESVKLVTGHGLSIAQASRDYRLAS